MRVHVSGCKGTTKIAYMQILVIFFAGKVNLCDDRQPLNHSDSVYTLRGNGSPANLFLRPFRKNTPPIGYILIFAGAKAVYHQTPAERRGSKIIAKICIYTAGRERSYGGMAREFTTEAGRSPKYKRIIVTFCCLSFGNPSVIFSFSV